MEDLRLEWRDDELEEVLDRGARALNIEIADALRASLVADAFGNVGLLQRGAEQLCREAGIGRRAWPRRQLVDTALLERSRRNLAGGMAGRFLTFADRLKSSGALYRDVVRAVTVASDDDLLNGIPLAELPSAIIAAGGKRRTRPKLREKLLVISDVQANAEVQPPVLAWDQPRNRLFLVDRSFLHYRKYGEPTWPWEA